MNDIDDCLLITSLRELAAARHNDLSIAVDAVIEIERLRAENERLKKLNKLLDRKEREFLAAIGLATTVLGTGYDPYLPIPAMKAVLAKVEQQRADNERMRADNELLRDDAMRYRWLREQNRLQLVSQSIVWTHADGSKFRPSHCLSANDTRYGVYETLDETIDKAMLEGKP